MGLKISTGVKTKNQKGFNGNITTKQTFFVNVFSGLIEMQNGKPLFTIKTDNFGSLIRSINKASHKFNNVFSGEHSLHNGWTKSQTSNETKRGLCLNKEQFAEVRSALEDLLVKSKPKVTTKNQKKHELIEA